MFLLLGTVTMILGSILANVPAIVLGLLVNDIFEAERVEIRRAAPYLGLVGASILTRQALDVVRRYFVEKTATGVERTTRHSLIERLTHLPLVYYGRHRTGEISGRVNRGVEGYVRLIKLGFMDFLPACALATTAVIAAMSRHLGMGLFMLCVVPTGMAIVLVQIRSEKDIRLDIKATKEKMDGTMLEVLNGIEPIRGLAAERKVVTELDIDLDRVRRVELRHHLRMSLFDAAKYGNEGLFQVGVIAVAVVLAGQGAITPGDILTFALLFGSIVAPLRELHRILDEAHESALHAADVFSIVDEKMAPQFIGERPLVDIDRPPEEIITATAVSFSYESGASPAVEDVSIAIGRGEFVGICGSSRSGKSTLLRLLADIYRPDCGRIVLFGRDLAEFPNEQRAGLVGYVPQAPWLFTATIMDNIACGHETSISEIETAAQLAQIHDEIVAMPDGYYTVISERGASLSGGQRQRIAIARAIVRRPQLLLLDEATSALDNVTERNVMLELEHLTDITIVAVAHRLTTLRHADRIMVMAGGKVVEMGSYETLGSSGGIFASLVSAAEQAPSFDPAA